jgi:hypothetical protein
VEASEGTPKRATDLKMTNDEPEPRAGNQMTKEIRISKSRNPVAGRSLMVSLTPRFSGVTGAGSRCFNRFNGFAATCGTLDRFTLAPNEGKPLKRLESFSTASATQLKLGVNERRYRDSSADSSLFRHSSFIIPRSS